jgi:hypothetical protein
MKCVLEFGVRGGNFTEVQIIPTQQLGAKLAAALVHVFSDPEYDNPTARAFAWIVAKNAPRKSWQSSTHFVSLSLLDGDLRGPASAQLWKKDN